MPTRIYIVRRIPELSPELMVYTTLILELPKPKPGESFLFASDIKMLDYVGYVSPESQYFDDRDKRIVEIEKNEHGEILYYNVHLTHCTTTLDSYFKYIKIKCPTCKHFH